MLSIILAFTMVFFGLLVAKKFTIKANHSKISLLQTNNLRLLAWAVLFLWIERWYFYAESMSLGFFFDYVIYLGSLYGNWAFLRLALSIFLLLIPLLYFFQKPRAWRFLRLLLVIAALFFVGFDYLFLEIELLAYRQAWSFAFGNAFLPLYSLERISFVSILWIGILFLWSVRKSKTKQQQNIAYQ